MSATHNMARLVEADAVSDDLDALMNQLGRDARSAASVLARADTEQKNKALRAMARLLRGNIAEILDANEGDLASMAERNVQASFIDRATLTTDRIESMAVGLEEIASLDDPVGAVIGEWERPNGLKIQRVRTPIGVVGVIYESRPNVTADAGGLALKSGNAAILRSGSDTLATAKAIHDVMVAGLVEAGLPAACIQLVPVADRQAVGAMLRGLDGAVDVIVPRGGRSLVARVQDEARVPVFAHLEGLCHIYVHQPVDLEMARSIIVNSKMRRTGICGAAETLLIDRALPDEDVASLISALQDADCLVRGDAELAAAPGVDPANDEDWQTEYLDAIISARKVDGLDEAIEHIRTFGSNHTEAILTDDQEAADRFLSELDSAIVMHNASTQFADGGEFGMGAEIGIATGKMHARGPVGVEQLTSFKYCVFGDGQTRP